MTDPANPSVTDPSALPVEAPLKDSVSYETHRKLLDEKKKVQARAEELEAKFKERELSDLTAKGETSKLLELARKEASEYKAKVEAQSLREVQAKKLSAIIRGMGTSIDEKWYGVIGQHIDEIVYDSEAEEIQQMSVTSVVENLKKTWPEMLKKAQAGMPNAAPQGNGALTILESEWKKLTSKEMRKWRPDQIT